MWCTRRGKFIMFCWEKLVFRYKNFSLKKEKLKKLRIRFLTNFLIFCNTDFFLWAYSLSRKELLYNFFLQFLNIQILFLKITFLHLLICNFLFIGFNSIGITLGLIINHIRMTTFNSLECIAACSYWKF